MWLQTDNSILLATSKEEFSQDYRITITYNAPKQMWQSRVENVHYSGMQLLRKTRLKILIFIGL